MRAIGPPVSRPLPPHAVVLSGKQARVDRSSAARPIGSPPTPAAARSRRTTIANSAAIGAAVLDGQVETPACSARFPRRTTHRASIAEAPARPWYLQTHPFRPTPSTIFAQAWPPPLADPGPESGRLRRTVFQVRDGATRAPG